MGVSQLVTCELAERYRHDRPRYTEAKTQFIEAVLRTAERESRKG